MKAPQIILGIETSCDETSAAVIQKEEDGVKILSNVVASSADLQAKYGGVIPEQAAREQLASIIPVIEEALRLASLAQGKKSLDAIAVTQGPGLIGSLLVGVETAKVLATVWKKPLVPVNHLLGHFYANWIKTQENGISTTYYGKDKEKPLIHNTDPLPHFPLIGLLVSGGHTDLVLMTNHGKYQYLGGTRDDAAGECFDKCARLLGLPYPGGPAIAQSAMEYKVQNVQCKVKLPRPLLQEKNFDFSFSGLKTAVGREIDRLKTMKQFSNETIKYLSYEIQEAITDVLVKKTIAAAQKYGVEQIIVAGGVAANQNLAKKIAAATHSKTPRALASIPPPKLCTDNAAYIAAAAFFNYNPIDPLALQADPNISLSNPKS